MLENWLAMAVADTAMALRTLPVLTLTALVLCSACRVAIDFLFSSALPIAIHADARFWAEPLYAAVWLLLAMPLSIQVHRLVAEGAASRHYALDFGSPRLMSYFGTWIVLLALAMSGPLAWCMPGTTSLPVQALIALWSAASIVTALRMSALLAAIAIEAPQATWGATAFATRGRIAGIAAAFAAASPVWLAGPALLWLAGHLIGTASAAPGTAVAAGASAAASVLYSSALVLAAVAIPAVSSRIWLALHHAASQDVVPRPARV